MKYINFLYGSHKW